MKALVVFLFLLFIPHAHHTKLKKAGSLDRTLTEEGGRFIAQHHICAAKFLPPHNWLVQWLARDLTSSASPT